MTPYFPTDTWQRRDPHEFGANHDELNDAVVFALDQEINWSTDLKKHIPNGKKHPNDRLLGPIKDRCGPSGVVVKNGFIVGEWGSTDSVEVTFSATKSYIAAVAGLALDKGLIKSIDDRVSDYVDDGGYTSEHNGRITWRHSLQQTSEWQGELFGLPDSIDRGRVVGAEARSSKVIGTESNSDRALDTPGSFWEYNDVRVNRTALSLLRVLDEPLPQVLKREVMDPIGASNTWQWHGYESSYVDLNGGKVQSVSGGAHWGGGLWINTFDHARFGLLFLRQGSWAGKQILSQTWLNQMLEPCDIKPEYGCLWWLNHEGSIASQASEQSFAARGAGGNIVFIEPTRELVVVLRWCSNTRAVLDRFLAAL